MKPQAPQIIPLQRQMRSQRDGQRIRKAIVFAALASSGIAAGLIAFGRQLVLLWVGRAIVVPLSIMVPLALLMVVQTIGSAGETLLYSANAARYVLRSIAAWSISRSGANQKPL